MIEMPNKKGVALLQKYNIVIYFYDNPSKTITLETKAESLVFSKDSNFIITTEDKKLIIWDIKQKKNIKEIDVPEKITYLDINFANDIIAAHHSEYIFFISYPEGKILHKIKEKDEYLTMSSFHPKNNSIVYVGQYGKVYHFDFDQKKSYPAWEHPGKLNVCKYSPSGQYIVTAGDNHEIRIWNAKDKVLFQKLEYSKITGPRKQILLSGHTNTIYDCSFSADENLLVSCGEDSQVKLWDIKEGELKNNFHGHISSVYSCHFYTDTYIFSTGDDHRLKKWHIDKTYPKKTVFISGINDFAVNHEKNLIAIAEQNYMITVWNTELWQPEYQFISLTKPMLIEFAFIQNRLKLVIGDKVGGIKIWDIAEKKIDKEVSFSKERIDFIDIQGSKCLIGTSKMAILYSLETYDILWTQKYEYHISSVKFSPDKQTFIVARKKTCDIYDCYSYKQLKTIEIGKGRSINTANFSKDGSLLALGMSNHYINIWDMQSLQEKALLKGHEGGVLFLDFNNKGNRLISSSEDCTVRIWDIEKKSLLLTLNQHTGHVNKCVFTQDNQSILSAGEDGYFLLWTYDKHELWD